jgi:charged multivesicular body protein 6
MGGRSSKPKQPAPTDNSRTVSDKDRAVLELKRQRDKLRQYRNGLESIIKRESEVARALLTDGNKKRAVMVLKKKKYQESLLARAQNQQLNVEQMIQDIESAAISKQVFDVLKMGNESLKALQAQMSVEDVEALMEDSAESIRIQEEMSSALATSLTPEEEDDVAAEYERLFAAMQAEEASEKAAPKQVKTPAATVPATATPVALAEEPVQPAEKPVVVAPAAEPGIAVVATSEAPAPTPAPAPAPVPVQAQTEEDMLAELEALSAPSRPLESPAATAAASAEPEKKKEAQKEKEKRTVVLA